MRKCKECGRVFPWERRPGQRGRPPLYCSPTCRNRARYVPKAKGGTSDPVTRSAAARRAAQARWKAISPAERSEIARKTARARYTPEQRARAEALRVDRAARRAMPCPYCGEPVGKAGRLTCDKPSCRLARNAARARRRLGRFGGPA